MDYLSIEVVVKFTSWGIQLQSWNVQDFIVASVLNQEVLNWSSIACNWFVIILIYMYHIFLFLSDNYYDISIFSSTTCCYFLWAFRQNWTWCRGIGKFSKYSLLFMISIHINFCWTLTQKFLISKFPFQKLLTTIITINSFCQVSFKIPFLSTETC